jgi:hypothetical protein
MGQKEMAALVGCSTVTIQKVENLGLKLSDGLAKRISHETGVTVGWLLDGDPEVPPKSRMIGAPYSKQIFEFAQSKAVTESTTLAASFTTLMFYGQIRSIYRSAVRAGDGDLAAYKLGHALRVLAKEFGSQEDFTGKQSSKEFIREIQVCFRQDIGGARKSLLGVDLVPRRRSLKQRSKRKRQRSLSSRDRTANA